MLRLLYKVLGLTLEPYRLTLEPLIEVTLEQQRLTLAVDAHPGAREVHSGTMETHPGGLFTLEAYVTKNRRWHGT